MTTQYVHELLTGELSTASKRQLVMFSKRLSHDRETVVFDDKILGLLMKYVHPNERNNLVQMVSELSKVNYSQSNYEYSQIVDQVKRFTLPNHSNFHWNENYKKAKAMAVDLVKPYRLRMLKYENTDDLMDSLPKTTTHAGFSNILLDVKNKGEYVKVYGSTFFEIEKAALNAGTFNIPLLPGVRTQASAGLTPELHGIKDFKSKSRLVSMVDVNQILTETRFASPFQKRLSHENWYAGGKNDNAILSLISTHRNQYPQWLSIDYSKFDQSISDWLIRDAFDVVRAAFDPAYFDEDLFSLVVNDFINKSFVLDGYLIPSSKGVPSGSMFTQIVDSIVNKLMIDTYLGSIGYSDYDMIIMGDDNLIFSKEEIDYSSLSSYLGKNFGINVSVGKSTSGISEIADPEFLSREWHKDGIWRELYELVPKMLYPEKFRPYHLGEAKPEIVLYSYISGYGKSLNALIDVREFMKDYPTIKSSWTSGDLKYLSGYAAYRATYG